MEGPSIQNLKDRTHYPRGSLLTDVCGGERAEEEGGEGRGQERRVILQAAAQRAGVWEGNSRHLDWTGHSLAHQHPSVTVLARVLMWGCLSPVGILSLLLSYRLQLKASLSFLVWHQL